MDGRTSGAARSIGRRVQANERAGELASRAPPADNNGARRTLGRWEPSWKSHFARTQQAAEQARRAQGIAIELRLTEALLEPAATGQPSGGPTKLRAGKARANLEASERPREKRASQQVLFVFQPMLCFAASQFARSLLTHFRRAHAKISCQQAKRNWINWQPESAELACQIKPNRGA